jgi:hypothetical protein
LQGYLNCNLWDVWGWYIKGSWSGNIFQLCQQAVVDTQPTELYKAVFEAYSIFQQARGKHNIPQFYVHSNPLLVTFYSTSSG